MDSSSDPPQNDVIRKRGTMTKKKKRFGNHFTNSGHMEGIWASVGRIWMEQNLHWLNRFKSIS